MAAKIQQVTPVAETSNFIVLDKYETARNFAESWQSEKELEAEFIEDLRKQGYEFLPDLNTPEKLLANARKKIGELNKVNFGDAEWRRFVENWLDRPGETMIDKTRRIHDDYI